jgi:tRNA (guanine37-N1)-methyltransferase
MVSPYLGESILGKAQEKGKLSVTVTDIRNFASGKHRQADDAPYGGGAGMVMKVEPVVAALEDAARRLPHARKYLMSPRGERLSQRRIQELSAQPEGLVLVCGRYEGVDERVSHFVDGELSLGDFILTGGELAALAVVDAVARLLPGVLGNADSAAAETFEEGLLEYPQYTRPPSFRGLEVPLVLQQGDHARIARWRRWKSLVLTQKSRPDLFESLSLSEEDKQLLLRGEEEL